LEEFGGEGVQDGQSEQDSTRHLDQGWRVHGNAEREKTARRPDLRMNLPSQNALDTQREV
ncbi:MAG: hypothetical protein PHW78_08400, partial [Macromonas bipunctata]|nr:hypothetical protein [Macromonas bipunctata]